jgi:hypothetical protein
VSEAIAGSLVLPIQQTFSFTYKDYHTRAFRGQAQYNPCPWTSFANT